MATFASDLSGNFAGVVQYNKDNRAFEVLISLVNSNLSRVRYMSSPSQPFCVSSRNAPPHPCDETWRDETQRLRGRLRYVRICSIYFTVTLAVLNDIVHYTRDFVIQRLVLSGFHRL